MKSQRLLTLASLVAAAAIAACGGSKSEEAGERTETAAEGAQAGADAMQKGAESMAKGFEAMAKSFGGGAGDIKPVEPASFRDLQAALPEVSGWERENPSGERMTSPFAYSQASVTLRKGDASIDAKILDSGFNQLLFAPFSMFMVTGYEKETSDGFERSVSIDGNPGWERWNSSSRSGELNVVVGKRFLIQIEGNDIDDVKVLRTVLDRTDLRKLSSLQ
jgi:hypothetical protein